MMCVRSAMDPEQMVTQVAQNAQWYNKSEYLLWDVHFRAQKKSHG